MVKSDSCMMEDELPINIRLCLFDVSMREGITCELFLIIDLILRWRSIDYVTDSLFPPSIFDAKREVLRSIESANIDVTSFSGRPIAIRLFLRLLTTVKSVAFLQ